MDSGMIGKIQKARMYADEPERMQFATFRVEFKGEHSTHNVEFEGGKWSCTCRYFQSHAVCSHTMALERVLGAMVTTAEVVSEPSL
jgi:hypothetical protein